MELLVNDTLFKTFSKVLSKKKEKFDNIVEPLQACYYICLLSYLPKGTKISIQDNFLYIQQPSLVQGTIRWYNNDNVNDLQYLVVIIKRFMEFYKNRNNKLFELMKNKMILGLDKLIETYQEKSNTLQTLKICKMIVMNSESFKELDDKKEIDKILLKITEIYDNIFLNILQNFLIVIDNDIENLDDYLMSISYLFNPFHKKIKKWITSNLFN